MNNSLFAKWIVPVEESPVKNGRLIFSGDHILSIDRDSSNVNENGNLIILPGLINLHSHLDYSNISFQRNSLFDWIEKLVANTRNWSQQEFENSAHSGAKKSLESGTTFIVDNSYSGQSALKMAEQGLKGIVGLEIFGVDQSAKDIAFKFWLDRFEKLKAELAQFKGNSVELTISPHAPYTVSPDLFKLCFEWAQAHQTMLLTHMSESPLENNWFRKGEKRLDDYLLNVLPPGKSKTKEEVVAQIDWHKTGKSSFQSIFDRGLINENTLLAHCVHLDQTELDCLKKTEAKIAHCPRSNDNLDNGFLELEPIFSKQISCGLGTDSLASTQTLSMLDEAKYLIKNKRLSLKSKLELEEHALRLITIEAAKAVKMQEEIGSLTPGKKADFVVLKSTSNLDDLDSNSIYSHILSDMCEIEAVFINGKCLIDNSDIETRLK